MSRFYATTPIYYVNAEPHLGHAYTTIVGDALTRWHRLLGDDVHFLTGTDEHGLKIQQAAEAAGLDPQAFADAHRPEVRRGVEAPRHRQRRLHPHDRAAPPRRRRASCCSAATTPATSSSTSTAASTACAARMYYTDDELLPGDLCPIHKLPVEEFEEENYFFRLSRFQDRLLDWYAAHPGRDRARSSAATRRSGLIRSGLRDFSVSRTSLTWGIPLPWDPTHVAYVWFDALDQLPRRPSASAPTRSGSTEWWPVDYHLIGKDIIRHHCVYWPAMLMSAGIEPPKGWAVGGWLLVDGEKMSKTTGNVVNPLDLVDTVGVDGFRYYVLADTPYGQDGDFTYEGLVGRYNADLANNLGNLVARVATVVGIEVRRHRPGAARRQPARRRRRRRRRRRAAAAWDVVAAEPRPRGDVAADPRHQRLPRGERAVEGRARVRTSTRCSATPSRRCGSSPILASPARPAHGAGDLGAHRPAPARSPTSACPATSRGAATPAASPVTKGAPLFPRIKA